MSGEAWETYYGNGMPLYQLVGALAEEINGRGVTGDEANGEDEPNVWEWLEQRDETDLAQWVRDLYHMLIQLEPLFKAAAWCAAGDDGDEEFAAKVKALRDRYAGLRQMADEARMDAISNALHIPRPAGYGWKLVKAVPSAADAEAKAAGIIAAVRVGLDAAGVYGDARRVAEGAIGRHLLKGEA